MPRPNFEDLLRRLGNLAAHPHLSPMNGMECRYTRARGSLLLAVLATNITVALKQDVGGGAGLNVSSLQELLLQLKRRLEGIVEEETQQNQVQFRVLL
jgi:hypothetical protein